LIQKREDDELYNNNNWDYLIQEDNIGIPSHIFYPLGQVFVVECSDAKLHLFNNHRKEKHLNHKDYDQDRISVHG